MAEIRSTSVKGSRDRDGANVFGPFLYCWQNSDFKSLGGIACTIGVIVQALAIIAGIKGIQGIACDGGVNVSNPSDWTKLGGCFVNDVSNQLPDNLSDRDHFTIGEPTPVEEEDDAIITVPTDPEASE